MRDEPLPVLTPDKITRASQLLRRYMDAPAGDDGKTPYENNIDLDQKRVETIDGELTAPVGSFLDGQLSLSEFKTEIDGINTRNAHWGFKGIKGQMFFNLLFNTAENKSECAEETRAGIALPANDDMASSRIKTFASYVKRVGEEWIDAGNTHHGPQR